MPHIIVGTAGHIDHGKTSLVKALTGIDADRLKEEKERGITIDIGFANLDLDAETTVGFVDVPGHERFIKNMLAGVGGIDLVMLVIASDESVMPQTREHLEICSLLRIRHGVTVLTKIDAVDPDIADLVELEVREYLKGSFLENAPVVRVSSTTGQGIPELIAILRKFSSQIVPKDVTRIFRLPIDRCFTMKGFGTVVTGTLISGSVAREDEIEILPSGRRTRVRGIQVHGHLADEASAGQRTAVNLQGVEVGDVQRGMVVTIPGVFTATSMLDCEVELLRSSPGPVDGPKRVRFHSGTAELMGYVHLIGQERLEPGQRAFAQIRLEEPAFVLPGDRFIIRQYSPMVTIGGGVVLDAWAEKHRSRDTGITERLTVLRDGNVADRVMLWCRQAAGGAATASGIAARLGLPVTAVVPSIMTLAEGKQVRVLVEQPLTVFDAAEFTAIRDRITANVRSFHKANPLVHGISREELRTRVAADVAPIVFHAAIEELIAGQKLAVVQDLIQEYGRTIVLDAEEEKIKSRLASEFEALGLQVPAPDEVIDKLKLDRVKARKLVQLLVKENVLIKITDDMILHRAVIEDITGRVRARKSVNPRMGVAEFKELTGASRKFSIPLLEYLDRQRITRRLGDERIIL